MSHPNVQVGEVYSFANVNGSRKLLTGKVTAISGDVATIYCEGKYRHVAVASARKVRTRKIRRVRRAIERGEY